MQGKQNRELHYTNIETQVQAALDAAGIAYVPQYPTRTGFVLDFALVDQKIAIEVDGPTHDTPKARSRDAFRTLRLKQEGWRVVRIHWTSLTESWQLPPTIKKDRVSCEAARPDSVVTYAGPELPT